MLLILFLLPFAVLMLFVVGLHLIAILWPIVLVALAIWGVYKLTR